MEAVIVSLKDSSRFKNYLKNQKLYNSNYLCKKISDLEIVIPIKENWLSLIKDLYNCGDGLYKWKKIDFRVCEDVLLLKNRKIVNRTPLLKFKESLGKEGVFEELIKDFPSTFEKFQDLLLLPYNCLQSPLWKNKKNLVLLADSHGCKRIAKKNKIKNDEFRSPNVEILLGSDVWVTRVENNIKYHFNLHKSMFSQGNITEKMRISKIDCSNQTIVDLYAGIGYFSLTYLLHTKCKLLYACEWNAYSVEALKLNLLANNIADGRCKVLQGDCNQVCPSNVADRVNLGLLPSSEAGWKTACKALRRDKGGILHIHGNVDENDSFNGGYKNKGDGDDEDDGEVENKDDGEVENEDGEDDDENGEDENEDGEDKDEDEIEKDEDDDISNDDKEEKSELIKTDNYVEDTKMTCNKEAKKSWMRWSEYVKASIETIMQELNLADSRDVVCGDDKEIAEDDISSDNNMDILVDKKEKSLIMDSHVDNTNKNNTIIKSSRSRKCKVEIKHIEHVKSYAPRVHHVVVDLKVRLS